jgi:hypothetical protein
MLRDQPKGEKEFGETSEMMDRFILTSVIGIWEPPETHFHTGCKLSGD